MKLAVDCGAGCGGSAGPQTRPESSRFNHPAEGDQQVEQEGSPATAGALVSMFVGEEHSAVGHHSNRGDGQDLCRTLAG